MLFESDEKLLFLDTTLITYIIFKSALPYFSIYRDLLNLRSIITIAISNNQQIIKLI